ncbi:MAG TPA: CheR family methyltransferase, partial [Gemmatimonadaceae bacterium]|nr:CheR family methyltransferase [Gemmatimonadaceae bacterium]
MQRRVLRRMLFRKVDTLAEYLELLRRDPEEVVALRRDLLINVTRFFRNPAAFEALTRVAFPGLIEGLSADEAIRVWVPGCATGEETYSIAICLTEYLAQANRSNPIQVFGTDLSEEAISVARRGVYSATIETDVSRERLDRFFTHHEHQYRVNPEVRTSCTFARQDVTRDPPLGHLHLVSCRNVLIYFQPELQARTLSIIHYALNPNGMLFLGPSESVGAAQTLFATVDKRHHLYARRAHSVSTVLVARSPTRDHETSAQRVGATRPDPGAESPVEGDGTRRGGHVGPHAPSQAARAPNRRRRPSAQRKGDDVVEPAPKGSRKRPTVASLEKELATLKLRLQSIVEEHDSEIEELRAADEEIQSSNEELQSTAEELETAKEELQSINEELTTVNDELQDRNGLLNALNDDLNNVAASIRTPVVIVTLDQRIRRYTAGAERLMNLIPSDVGRPIADLRSTLDSTILSSMISEAIDSLRVNETDVQDRTGHWYSMVVRPYKTSDQRIDGAVIVFHDIDARKGAAMAADVARKDAV